MNPEKQKQVPEEGIPDSPHMNAIRLLLRVVHRHHACVERRIGDLSIHHSQHRMLMHLAMCTHMPSQKELAEALGISPAAVATALKRLEKEGYIARTMQGEDNRRNEIRITELGRAKVVESREIFESVDRAMFEGLTEEELCVLSRAIRKMDENLDTLGAPADPCRRADAAPHKKGDEHP